MDFDLSEEQSILKDSLDRLLADAYGFEQRRRHMGEPEGWSPDMWRQFAEMGLMALPFAEADGGLGGSAVETMIVMEAMGRALVVEPYFSTVVVGGSFLRLGGNDDQRAELIPQVAEGALKLAFAHTERNARYDLVHVETTARSGGDGYLISGRKMVVLHGDSADRLIVSARTSGNARDEDGISLFLVDRESEGVTVRGYRTQDGQRAADISFENVRVDASQMIGTEGAASPLIAQVVDISIAALSAEAVGVMERMQKETTEYLKVRKQFGVPIGAFQVLQHAAVDMFVAAEQARSMSYFATMMADSDDAAERSRAMHAAKVEIGRAGKLCGENAIQLHGGVGMTMEYAIGHYFKRMSMIDITFGDHEHHLAALAREGGLLAA
jgi:pimeloyl-CoA dehydrogenase small subunit